MRLLVEGGLRRLLSLKLSLCFLPSSGAFGLVLWQIIEAAENTRTVLARMTGLAHRRVIILQMALQSTLIWTHQTRHMKSSTTNKK